MAKFTVRAENFCLISHSTSSKSLIFDNPISLNHPPFHLLPSKRCLSCRVWCSIKEKENVKETDKFDGVLLRVDELDQASSVSDSEGELGHMSGSDQVGSEWNWPPRKNIPERYKLIGTTSLAFVICNMDKVNLSVAIIPMSHQFGWSSSVAGLVQSSFFWGYALSQLPGGWLAKKSSSDWSTDLVLGYSTCTPCCWIYAWTSFFKDFGKCPGGGTRSANQEENCFFSFTADQARCLVSGTSSDPSQCLHFSFTADQARCLVSGTTSDPSQCRHASWTAD